MVAAKSSLRSDGGRRRCGSTHVKASYAFRRLRTELLFVTLDKSEKRFSTTTSYEDYAISPDLFHWQSQSLTSADSESGRRYREQATNGWRFLLFVRPTVRDVYTYLGLVQYVSHQAAAP